MDITLTLYEARVIGCLIEKEITTPDQYPLSLNALSGACNQKSNREPVMALDESTVQQTLDELIKKRLVLDKSGFGSRVVKYRHRFCNSEFGNLKFSQQELGIICVLLLRGPQTPGELRTRTNRLCKFSDVHEVESTLAQLMERDDGPFVVRLPHEAGKRELRYAHLFSGEVQIADSTQNRDTQVPISGPDNERLDQLERLVSELRQELERLEERIGQLESRGAVGQF
ncbi:MAG: DUF480 domain-containing protein [Pseudomonadota bacterium]|nr:DUF480 domain-containing protein [Pseudomonadota bacterium]